MKYLFSLILMLGLFTTASQAQKLGYVNSQTILKDMPSVKAANAEIEALQKQLQKKGETMVNSLREKYQGLEQKEANGELSPKQLQDEAAKLEQERLEIAQFEQEMNQQVGSKQEALLQPILDKVNGAIETVAKEEGFLMIFDGSIGSILYADDTADITDKVKSKLGM